MPVICCALSVIPWRRLPRSAIFPTSTISAESSRNTWESHRPNLSKNISLQNENRQYPIPFGGILPHFYDSGTAMLASIFSMNIPYPVVGALIKTWVTAPMSLPSWIRGEPDRSVVKKGQQFYKKIFFSCIIFSSLGIEKACAAFPREAYLCSPIE